jgi:hypothetical protein
MTVTRLAVFVNDAYVDKTLMRILFMHPQIVGVYGVNGLITRRHTQAPLFFRNENNSYNAEKSDINIGGNKFMKKTTFTVCKCPRCQTLVEVEKSKEFENRTCGNCGTIFRKIVETKWKIIKDAKDGP